MKEKISQCANNKNIVLMMAFVAVLSIIMYIIMPSIRQGVFSDNSEAIYLPGETDLQVLHADLDDNGIYQPTSGDPQICLIFHTVHQVNSYCITFGEPLPEDTEIQLYYAGVEEKFSEQRVYKTMMKAGNELFCCDLPAGECERIRTDINGPCKISSIRISKDRIQYRINWIIVPMLLVSVLLCIAVIVLIYFLWISERNQFLKTKKARGQRLIHIEIMRIIAAFFVIFNHTGDWGFKLFLNYESNTITYWLYMLFSVVSKISVPLFFMISGALMLKKQDEPAKKIVVRIIRVLCALLIFSAAHFAQEIHFGNEQFSVRRFFSVFISDEWFGAYWYLWAYIGFLLTLPLLRRLAHALNNLHFKYMILLVTIIDGVIPIVMYIASRGTLKFNTDLSVAWVANRICFYPLIGYYLENRIQIKDISKRIITGLWLVNLFSLALTCYVTHLNDEITGRFPQTYMMSLVQVNAICIYLTLKKMTERKSTFTVLSYIVQEMGKCTFGIYLLHGMILRDSRISLYLRIEHIFDEVPMFRECLRCAEVMLIGGLLTWVLRKLPLFRKIL